MPTPPKLVDAKILEYGSEAHHGRLVLAIGFAVALSSLVICTVSAIMRRAHRPIELPSTILEARAQMALINDALGRFENDTGRYPTADEGIASLGRPPEGIRNWHGPYIASSLTTDPWGRRYRYVPCVKGSVRDRSFRLWSSGPDGVSDTSDDIDDPKWR